MLKRACLTRASGVGITAGEEVKQRFSLCLQKKRLEEVLAALAQGYGLVIQPQGESYLLGEPAAAGERGLPGETQVYPLRYLNARQARGLLPNFLLPYLRADDRGNQLTLTGPQPLLAQARAQLAQLDQPGPNVQVEATLVEFSSRTEEDFALGGSRRQADWQLDLDSAGAISYEILVGGETEFHARLDALIAESKARLWAKKQITVMSGEAGEIFFGQERNIILEYEQDSNRRARIEKLDIGAKLAVTARAGGGDEIWLTLAPQVSNLQELAGKERLPVVALRSAASTIRVKQGAVVAIGGLKLRQEDRNRSRLPLLGKLSGGRSRSNPQTETVIFLTARKVEKGETIPCQPKG